MSAAKNIKQDLLDLFDCLDEKWRENVELIDLASEEPTDKAPGGLKIGISNDSDPTIVLDLALNNDFRHICHFSNQAFESELNTSASMIVRPEEFVKFPISTVLAPGEACDASEAKYGKYSVDFSSGKDKQETLARLDAYLEDIARSESLRADIRVIADELFTNAVFNAPFINESNGKNPNKDRTDDSISLDEGDVATLFAGDYEGRFIIGCRDPYGSLNIEKFLKRIRQCYTDGVGESIRMGPGGAGIGSYMVFNTSVSIYVGVIQGECTVVCCSLPLKMSSRKRGALPKNIHLFEISKEDKS